MEVTNDYRQEGHELLARDTDVCNDVMRENYTRLAKAFDTLGPAGQAFIKELVLHYANEDAISLFEVYRLWWMNTMKGPPRA